MRVRRVATLSTAVLMVLLLEAGAFGQDPFEVQVYEYETVPRRMWNLETHLNYIGRGPKTPRGGTVSIIRHGFYNTNSGKRRRYRRRTCGKTFCVNTATPYHRLQHHRATFDEVATLSVEGLNKSAIARVKQIA